MGTETDKCYANPWYENESGLDNLLKNEFMKELKITSNNLLSKLEKNGKSQQTADSSDYSVYTGSTGIYYLYWFMNKKTKRQIPQERIQSLIAICKSGLKGRRFSFLCGDAGPLTMVILTSSPLIDKKFKASCLKKLIDLKKIVLARDPETANEVLYGRAGYLWALLFLNQHAESDDLKVSGTFISQVVASIIDAGLGRHKDRLYFEWHEKEYIGAAHGYIGVLYVLLKAKEYWAPGHESLIKQTLVWLTSSQRFSGGNFKSSVGSKEDKLVHWCHGAPGGCLLLLEAANVWQSQEYLQMALDCGIVIWDRGLLKKGYGICHGVSGNAYSLMALYMHTKDELWLKRSYSFAQYCFHYGTKNIRDPDRPFSLFEGLAGVVYMLMDFLEASPITQASDSTTDTGTTGREHTSPKFPAFQL